MPMLVSTPEDWFRNKKKDLYLFEYQVKVRGQSEKAYKAWSKKYQEGQKTLFAWFEQNLPVVQIDFFGPSEYSGWIEGGPCAHGADLDESSQAVFRTAWHKPGSPWQLELQSFEQWSHRIDSCRLLPIPLAVTQSVRWWDMPGGIVLLSKGDDGRCLSRWDAWWRLVQLIPELANAGIDDYPSGEYLVDETHGALIAIDYGDLRGNKWNGDAYQLDTSRIAKLHEALGISIDQPVRVVVGD